MVLSAIRRKCRNAGLVRHINGNRMDNRVTNLQYVVFDDIFNHPSWTIDYACVLTPSETQIVDRLRAVREVRVNKIINPVNKSLPDQSN